jgi:hypothetical protein
MPRFRVGVDRANGRPKSTAGGDRSEPRAMVDAHTIDQARERTRGWIAIALFAPLSIGVLFAVLALVFGKLTVADLKELFASLSLNTLIGAATGTRSSQASSRGRVATRKRKLVADREADEDARRLG